MSWAEIKILIINDIEIWSETFGEKGDPAILLIGAAGMQGIMFPEVFCQNLADQGHYVIRFDHRDMGQSSPILFEKSPYDLWDLARDSIGVLDGLSVKKAHVVGLSMGGNLACILAKDFASRVPAITIINSSSDLNAFLDPASSKLPGPQEHYVEFVTARNQKISQGVSFSEKVELFTKTWQILHGCQDSFDETLHRNLLIQSFSRARNLKGFDNHLKAMKASLEKLTDVYAGITTPTLIISGRKSPIFSEEHALDLAAKISHANLAFIEEMGHIINPHIYKKLQSLIITHDRNSR